MEMHDALKTFSKQFEFNPIISNKNSWKKALMAAKKNGLKFMIAGMGGSQLAAELLPCLGVELDLVLHKDYGLPIENILKNRLIIASSYSGNTEETIDSFEVARKKNLPILAITTGGILLEKAKKYGLPYIELPNAGVQPRCALGLSFRALLLAMNQEKRLTESTLLAKTLNSFSMSKKGMTLAQVIKGYVPIIYTSTKNAGLGYNWKIKLNETGKIPAFQNKLPELNHNEMNAFDATGPLNALTRPFYFVFLKDSTDHPRILKRMEILKKILTARNLPVTVWNITGKNRFHAIFSSILFADWTAYFTAKLYGVDPNEVPMVEEFKSLLKR